MRITGAKSVSRLIDRLGISAGTAAIGAVTENSVYPSAGCLSTSPMPCVITAPGLSSTIVFQPSRSESALATMRARMSGGVLAEFGTTKRMTFDGNVCPRAGANVAAPRPSAAAPLRNARLFMAFSHWLPSCPGPPREGASRPDQASAP
jgi:hypothetical protein